MSKKPQDADFYQAHKDDPELWGEPEPPTEPGRRGSLTATITVRFSAEEAEAIRRLAKQSKLTYSDIVRKAVQAFTQPRFTIRDGVVYQPLIPSRDVRQAAEEVVRLALGLHNRPLTETGTSPDPVSRSSAEPREGRR